MTTTDKADWEYGRLKEEFRKVNKDSLDTEAQQMTELLKGKILKSCFRHDSGELVIVFKDGSKLFVNAKGALAFSIT